ncbi:MAG TPA: VWA domain-containing protein [Opitutaceae bacterium]|nr:VWA domain-containing protein [Opitutaceae bacterium]
MTFAFPHLLWLVLLPIALLAFELTRRRRAAATAHPKILAAEAGRHDLSLVPAASPSRRVRPWLAAGLVLLVVALARPQWGRIEEPVFDQAREILIALDLSRSMQAQDVKPSRLARAKLLIQSLLEKLQGERVGLVTFSGTAFLQCPLSSDYEILREFLPALDPGFLPEGGTNYRAMIETSLDAFGRTGAADRFLIVLSDGEATEDDWKGQLEELRKKGVRVIGLGVGTTAGAMIPDGSGGFVKDERGAVVLSRLENRTLQELAETTHGTYSDASSWVDLAAILRATVEAGQRGKFVEKNTVRLVERYQWPLALGAWCLCVSFCFEFPVRPRPRDLQLRGTAPAAKAAPAAATVAALLVGLVLLGVNPPAFADEPAASPPPLSKIVARLSTQDDRTARDWAELARETVTWGQHIQSEGRPVPPRPVHDALAAVKLGSAQDAKTADWPKLREELEALLQEPEKKPQQQQQQDQSKDQKDQQQQQQQQQNQEQQQKQQEQQKQQSQQQKSSSSPQDQSQQSPPPKPDQNRNAESAFGDMKEPPKPPPSHDTQKVGGVPEKKEGPPPPSDPNLALPLQKLDQLRNQDSPAQLYQLMDTDKKHAPAKKTGKDW